jgi:hypothetical protein
MLKLFAKRPNLETAAGVKAALAETEAALAKAKDRLAELERDRPNVLLEGGTVAEKFEAGLAQTRLEVERLEAVAAGLRDRLPGLERSERRAELEARSLELLRKSNDVAEAIVRQWPELAAKMRDLLRAEKEVMCEISDFRREVIAAGELAKGIEIPHVPAQAYLSPEVIGVGLVEPMAFCARTVIPSFTSKELFYWT